MRTNCLPLRSMSLVWVFRHFSGLQNFSQGKYLKCMHGPGHKHLDCSHAGSRMLAIFHKSMPAMHTMD